MITVQEQLEMAMMYHQLGLHPMALPFGSKKPKPGKRWKNQKPHTEYSINREFGEELSNIALLGGSISKNAFFLDFDDLKTLKSALKDIPYFEDLASHTIAVGTSRGSHYYFRSEKTIRTSNFLIGGGEVRGQGAYVVAPPSLHPNGHDNYSFIGQSKSILEIDLSDSRLKEFIGFFNIKPFQGEIQNDSRSCLDKQYGIPLVLWKIVRGEKSDKYRSRSEAEQAVILYLARNKWTFTEISNLFNGHAGSGTKYKEKQKEQEHDNWLRMSYESAMEYIDRNRNETDEIIIKLFHFAESYPWHGTSGRTDQSVFLAMLSIARRAHKLTDIGASVREVAELAGVSHMTAHRSLKRHSFLERIKCDETGVFDIQVDKCYIPAQGGGGRGL